MSSEQSAAGEAAAGEAAAAKAAAVAASRWSLSMRWATLIGTVLVLNIVAFVFFPPFPKGEPGAVCPYPACFIDGNLEFPAPQVVWDPSPSTAPPPGQILTFHVSITSTIITMWIITVVLLVLAILTTRRRTLFPGKVQNFVEFIYESLTNFGTSLGGPAARRYIPLFAALFIYILACNWSGLIPPVGKVEQFRAPTSDVNITIGLALVSFAIFHIEGVRNLGIREYLSKFFPFYEFKGGIGAGAIAMFVGLVELLLEFVKPLTLSMRLFGNIYGGEVALGVMTALTVALVPVALLGLELMLNFIQALIFAVLTLMFTLGAIESHHHEEGEMGHEAMQAVHDSTHLETRPAAAH